MSPADLSPYQLMQKAADFFERLNVAYRVVGSMATMTYGEVRFTNDVDILADLQEEHAAAIDIEFPSPELLRFPAGSQGCNSRSSPVRHYP